MSKLMQKEYFLSYPERMPFNPPPPHQCTTLHDSRCSDLIDRFYKAVSTMFEHVSNFIC